MYFHSENPKSEPFTISAVNSIKINKYEIYVLLYVNLFNIHYNV